MNLTGLLHDRAAAHPDRVAFIYEDQQVTFAEFDRRVDSVANALRASGLGPGDRVAILDKNSLAHVEVLFGAARAGAVQVPVNYRLAPDEVAYIVDNAKARILIVGAEFVPLLDAIADRLEHAERLIVIGETSAYEDYAVWSDHEPTYQDDSGEIFVQLYSSGTTGVPKGVMLTHDNFLAVMPMADQHWDLGPDSRMLYAMPLYHIAGTSLVSVGGVWGGFPGVIIREADPVAIAKTIETHRVTHTFLVPVLLMVMQQIPQIREMDLSSLKLLLYGASPISDEVLQGAMRLLPGAVFLQVYGLTETTGAIAYLPWEDHKPGERLRSAGIAFPHTELKIIDPATGEERPTGEVGEILCRTTQNMRGYWAMERETSEALLPDGWLRTGDAGYLDADGYLFIHDRVKDMIISGGENIYPAEVENILMSHPAVADCAVIGVPDQKWGETPKAIVVRDGGAGEQVTDRDLIDYCRSRLAHFKCPTSVEWTDAIPRNPTGKVLKRELRAPYWAGESRAVH